MTSREYFNTVYEEACQLTAYLCHQFNINPHGSVEVNGKQIPTILCHADAHALGMGNNHGDVLHWFPKFGHTMAKARNDVKKILEETYSEVYGNTSNNNITVPSVNEKPKEENKEIIQSSSLLTQEQFNEMMNTYLTQLARQPANSWSKEAREWCEANGIIKGDGTGNSMYRKFLTREEAATLIYRLHGQEKQ